MSFRDRIRRWLIADDELSEMMTAADMWLARNERFRLDQADGVGVTPPLCLEVSDDDWPCGLYADHNGDEHMSWDCRGNLRAVWAVADVDGGDTDEADVQR